MKMRFEFIQERVKRFNNYLDKLYYSGKLKLNELQSFRDIITEINMMNEKLKSISLFGYIPEYAKKDINKLDTELTLIEYNVSLILTGSLCAA